VRPDRCKECGKQLPPPRSPEWRERPRNCDECRAAKRIANGVLQRAKRRADPAIAKKDREYWRERYLANREEILVSQCEKRRSPEYKARFRAYIRRYYQEHKAEWDARTRSRERRFKRSSNGRQCDWRDIRIFWVLQSGLCFWCDAPLAQDDFHVDHLIPLSKGGKHERANMVLSCPTCNLRKHALLPMAFAARLRKTA